MRARFAIALAATLSLAAACDKSEPPAVIDTGAPAAPAAVPTPAAPTPAEPAAGTPVNEPAVPAPATPAAKTPAATPATPAAKTPAAAPPSKAAPATPVVTADLANGQAKFAICRACHSLTGANGVGPHLDNVFGRRAGSLPDYAYSDALKAANITWNDATLNTWLAGPARMVPGTKMLLSIANEKDRTDIIAWLKTQ